MVKDNPLSENIEDEELAAQDTDGHCGVGCCSTSFHVVDSEEAFQELLRGLQDRRFILILQDPEALRASFFHREEEKIVWMNWSC